VSYLLFRDNAFTGHYSLTQISMDVDLVWKSFKLSAEIKLLISPANNKRCHFASAQLIIKRNFLNTNASISVTIGRIFMKSHTLHSTRMRYKWITFVSDQSIIMATVRGQPCTFWLYRTFQWSDFPKKKLYLALSSLYLGFDWRNFRENS